MISGVSSGPPTALPSSQARPVAESGDAASRGAETSPRRVGAADAELAQLKARDREVRAHEQAHASVGGRYAGTPSYTYQRGPNGVLYAVGGEVNIDTAPVANDPEATVEKMRIVERAALAPMDPSSQDRRIAAEARQERAQAEQEAAREQASALDGRSGLLFDARA